MLLAIATSHRLSTQALLVEELIAELKPRDLWWDNASYARYQSGCEYEDADQYDSYQVAVTIRSSFRDEWDRRFGPNQGDTAWKSFRTMSQATSFAYHYRNLAKITIRKYHADSLPC